MNRYTLKRVDRDHPRVCGENLPESHHPSSQPGSPPRVRGKPQDFRQYRKRRGITPACAGKTCPSRTTRAASRDHPRVCGENEEISDVLFAGVGSPPRVRGKLYLLLSLLKNQGITPACAGKTPPESGLPFCPRDHPRVCGENDERIESVDDFEGSPPRVRGKLRRAHLCDGHIGITPACAGKTPALPSPARRPRDHPRACGENLCIAPQILFLSGSPPRMRGKHSSSRLIRLRAGITPAHAGKTHGGEGKSRANRDHPRACGENR